MTLGEWGVAMEAAKQGDMLAMLSLADDLEEQEKDCEIQQALRWMARTGLYPWNRARTYVRKPWLWYGGKAPSPVHPEEFYVGYKRYPHAILPAELAVAIRIPCYRIYETWHLAVSELGKGLKKLEQVLEGKMR